MHAERIENRDFFGWRPAGRPKGAPPSLEGSLGAGSQLEYNPLGISVGSTMRLNSPDLDGLEVEVEQILGTVITHEGVRYHLADYVLAGPMTPQTASLADRDGSVRLRLRCSDDGNGGVDVTVFQAQHLAEEATRSFENLAATDGPVTLQNSSAGYEDGFERIDGVRDVYVGTRTVVGGEGSEGAAAERKIESLDYSREQPDGDGGYYTQWALVEHNPATHDMITLFGWSIAADSIERVDS